jgi:hypothetical protein
LGQVIEHLGRPNHGYMGRFAELKDLFLSLGQAFVAAFHGKVTPRDHHPHLRASHGRQQQLRQVLKRLFSLDLQDDARLPITCAPDAFLQFQDVLDASAEGQAHRVRITNHCR